LGTTVALVCLCAVAGCSGNDQPGGDFTLLTYNVAGLPQEISQVNPEEHIPLISPLLDDYDVVVTQEDFDWWGPLLDGLDFAHYHERLWAKTTQRYRTEQYPGPEAAGVDTVARPTVQVGDGLGILSRFAFHDAARVPWPGCFGGLNPSDGGAADCLAAKGFAMVTLTLADEDDAPTVDVYTLHAEAGATDEDQRLQEEDFVVLAAYITEHSKGRAVIVAGDTNLHTDSDHPDAHGDADTVAWKQFLESARLTDACDTLDCDEPDSIDKVAFRSGDDVRLDAEDLAFPRDRFVDTHGEPLSDHPPLVVTFGWTAIGT
jgi:endonuclease/exonuclease/phosphatase family metal-dependent hydrolase